MRQQAHGKFSNAAVTTLGALVTIPTRGADRLMVQFVVGTANLSNFVVEGICHPEATLSTLATATGDFTTPVFPVRKASGDLNAAASGATSHFLIMECAGLHAVKLSAAGTSSTVTGYWSTF